MEDKELKLREKKSNLFSKNPRIKIPWCCKNNHTIILFLSRVKKGKNSQALEHFLMSYLKTTNSGGQRVTGNETSGGGRVRTNAIGGRGGSSHETSGGGGVRTVTFRPRIVSGSSLEIDEFQARQTQGRTKGGGRHRPLPFFVFFNFWLFLYT